MEPLSTFFRISPTLLIHSFNTPRSQSSSSFSSPSFADHQTGLKVYRESPASLTSAHQDNPLFEGFPQLPVSDRKAETSGDISTDSIGRAQGDARKLQEQLHHLLMFLQHTLKVYSDDGLPDDLAPKLADELEAIAKKLKEKEREKPVERQLRAKVHIALTGAEATIRKLRATPARSTPTTSWAVRRCRGTGITSPITSVPQSSFSSEGVSLQIATACGGCASGGGSDCNARDSVCRQLLQSPSSSCSPLSWTGRTAVVCTPMCATDDASMASPKELPTDQQRSQRSKLTGSGSNFEHVLIPTGLSPPQQKAVSSGSCGAATSSSFQAPLYNWMKAVLASAGNQGDSDATGQGGGAFVLQSPTMCSAMGDSLAVVVRTALSNTITPPLVYGSPLYRRIKRLLAEQWSPSPMRHDVAKAGRTQMCGESVEQPGASDWDSEAGSGVPTWGQEMELDSMPISCRYSDTSSSCNTPIMTIQNKMEVLPFRSSISPFGPPLRERFATRSCTAAPDASSMQRPPTVASRPSAATPLSLPHPRVDDDSPEAAELLAELGLDLQLDAEASGNISNLEVLEHVERWAREQFMAAKRVLEASKEAALREGGSRFSGSAGSSNCVDLAQRPLVDIAFQMEYPAESSLLVRQPTSQEHGPSVSTARSREAAVDAMSKHQLFNAQREGASVGAARAQLADNRCAGYCDVTIDEDTDVCSPSQGDQLSKRSSLSACDRAIDAVAAGGGRILKVDSLAHRTSNLTMWARNRVAGADTGGIPARRGIFGFTPVIEGGHSIRSSAPAAAGSRYRGGDDCRLSPLVATVDHLLSLDSSSGHALSQQGRSARTYGACASSRGSPAAVSSTGPVASSRQEPSSDEAPLDVLFTPGTSYASRTKVTSISRHVSRVFSTISGGGRDLAGGLTRHTPSEEIANGIRSDSFGTESCGRARGMAGAVGVNEDSVTAHSGDSIQLAPEVVFTPGNSLPVMKNSDHVRVMLPFRLDRAIQFKDDETDEDDGSIRTLSSISSVSIIGTEPANGPEDPTEEGLRSGRRSPSQAPDSGAQGKLANRPAASGYLCGLFASLLPCAHGNKAS